MSLRDFGRWAGIVAPLVVVAGLAWGLPAEPEVHSVQVGSGKTWVFQNSDASGTHSFFAKANRTHEELQHVALEWSIDSRRGEASGEAYLTTRLTLLVDGQRLHERTHTSAPGNYQWQVAGGVPEQFTELENPLPERGLVEFRVEMDYDVKRTGTHVHKVTMGPIVMHLQGADLDGDGLADSEQLLPIHTALWALPLGLVASAVAWLMLGRPRVWRAP